MAYTVNIKYTAPEASAHDGVDIPSVYVPNNAAADLDVFKGTYYDTNVPGVGIATDFKQYVKDSVAHPGLIAALKLAAESENGEYDWDTSDENVILYIDSVKAALADEGFELVVSKN